MFPQMSAGLLALMDFGVILFILLGTILGIIVGALPGLSSTMGVALLIPITFNFEPILGLCMLGGIYVGSVYGGSITAILLRTPGTSASIATSWDGYELTKKGMGGRAIGISTLSSFVGGTISALFLLFIAPPLARFSLKFGASEKFLLAVLGLTIIINISSNALLKGLITGAFGILLSTTGQDLMTGSFRFTFDMPFLYSGMPLLPTLIGLFSFSQALNLIHQKQISKRDTSNAEKMLSDRVFPTLKDTKKVTVDVLKSSILGVLIGIIPGAGTGIGSYVGYNEAKRSSKNPEEFGKGTINGVAASESANNAVTGGSLIPLLTLGIPGNAVSAVFLGGLLIHGLVPGPELFTTYGEITYAMLFSLFLANIAMFIFGIGWAKLFVKLTRVSTNILIPIIIVLSVTGSFAMRNNYYDIFVMFIFGLIGFVLEKQNYPLAPIVLAIILGPIAESELRRFLNISQGNLIPLVTEPINIVLIVLIILSFVVGLIQLYSDRKITPQ